MQEAKKLPKDADGRLKGYFGTISDPSGTCERVFCTFCGAPAGWTSKESSKHEAPQHIVVTCSDCDAMAANLGMTPVPQHMLDAYGLIGDAPVLPEPEKKEIIICTG